MTTTTAPHPAFPGFTAAFIEHDEGQPLTYMQYSGNVGPAVQFNGEGNTREPDPLNIPALDAQLAADAYLRIGDWSWTAHIWGCVVRQITIPAGMMIRSRDSKLTPRQAIEVIAAGASALTVSSRGKDSESPADLRASVLPVNTLFAHGARVGLIGGIAHSPEVSRTRIAVSALATDIAEAANLIIAGPTR